MMPLASIQSKISSSIMVDEELCAFEYSLGIVVGLLQIAVTIFSSLLG